MAVNQTNGAFVQWARTGSLNACTVGDAEANYYISLSPQFSALVSQCSAVLSDQVGTGDGAWNI